MGNKKRNYRSYIFVGLLLFFVFYLPISYVESWRSFCVNKWQIFSKKKEQANPSSVSNALENRTEIIDRENRKVEENYYPRLQQQNRLQYQFLAHLRIENQLKQLKKLQERINQDVEWKNFFRRRKEERKKRLDRELKAITAQVIYRDPLPWSTSLWIDVGEKDNRVFDFPIVKKNSPILYHSYLIGWIEYVGEKNSRVRLLTDNSAVVSVRAIRGHRQDWELYNLLSLAYSQFLFYDSNPEKEEETHHFRKLLKQIIETMPLTGKDDYLAKGELVGSFASKGRYRSSILKGVGFNYDYADSEGEEVDLRRGKSREKKKSGGRKSLLKRGDLLITTGLDGIFPSDLPVAIISDVSPLDQAAAWYDIKAHLCAGDLAHINIVSVLPSLEFSKEECF